MASSLKSTASKKVFTHEGAPVLKVGAKERLTRTVCSCLLWENSFYEDGVAVADRIKELVPQVAVEDVVALAIRARTELNLRHVPLFLARELARYPESRKAVATLLPQIILRPDELAEFLAMYWLEGRIPIAHAVRKGLAKAFTRFDEYQLAKYNRDKDVKLRDVLRVVHPVPKDHDQSDLFKRLKEGNLKTPYTWEVELSASSDKKQTWTELLESKKLGAMALIRNLRNMTQAGVSMKLVREALSEAKTGKLFPYRFITAANHNPHLNDVLEKAMLQNLAEMDKFEGRTVILADVSGSMNSLISGKSETKRDDASGGLAILIRELCDDVGVYAFGNTLYSIPNRRGFALRDLIKARNEGTYLRAATEQLLTLEKDMDRLIIITDEQSHDGLPIAPKGVKGYLVNVASYQNGVGYDSGWTHIHGWSDSVTSFIKEYESMGEVQE